jgi:hypothetical protein
MQQKKLPAGLLKGAATVGRQPQGCNELDRMLVLELIKQSSV